MADRPQSGVLDTCVYIDLDRVEATSLPVIPEITAITMAELHQGVAMATDIATRVRRTEKLGAAVVDFEPLPFDRDAATRYGTLVSLTMAAGRSPRPSRLDLMIAAIASIHELPLYTRNARDFVGLEEMITVIEV